MFFGDLVYDKLGVPLYQQAADSQPYDGSQPSKETLVFGHVVRGSEAQQNGVLEGVTVRGGEDHPGASPL